MEYLIVLGIAALLWWLTTMALQPRKPSMEERLSLASRGWTLPILVGSYESNPAGTLLYQQEANVLARHGYYPLAQSSEGSHLHAGRLIATGGLSILAGQSGIRSEGRLTVTFEKRGH